MEEKIEEKYIYPCIIVRLILWFILAIPSAIGVYFHVKGIIEGSMLVFPLVLWGSIVGAAILSVLIYAVIFPFVEYRNWRYLITDDEIQLRYGVLFKTRCILPVLRIQHVEVFEGLFNRMFGLAVLIIDTAGATKKIKGLSKKKADELCEDLKQKLDKRILLKEVNCNGN